MEDDDEFGDLYTDVLRHISSSSAPQPPLFFSPASSAYPPLDLNPHSDDEQILYRALAFPSENIHQNLDSEHDNAGRDQIPCESIDAASNLNDDDRVEEEKEEELDSPNVDMKRVLETGDLELYSEIYETSGIEKNDEDGILMEKGGVFSGLAIDVEIVDMDLEPIIPGLSNGGEIGGDVDGSRREDCGGFGDDWENDSDDDLQIVLNENSRPSLGIDRNEAVRSENEEKEEEDLVIVGDSDQNHQPIEEQEWGEDSAQAADGERTEMGEASKENGGMINAVGARIGFSNHGYHQHHSQFKFVRPGAAAMPEGAVVGPGGAPGQVRPLFNMGPIAGRGRGNWRPIGIKTSPTMQKSFHSGFGLPVWGNNSSGRGFGSRLEFTLSPRKTIFDIDIDSFGEKPWRHPGVDASVFFNFGLDEENWKDYCKQLASVNLSLFSLLYLHITGVDFGFYRNNSAWRLLCEAKFMFMEVGGQSRRNIHMYCSYQDYDPYLPPELAAAAGILDVSVGNAHLGKIDIGQGDLRSQGRGTACIRSLVPTGRSIQVEGGNGERLPSIDTRPSRVRDSDAIIEIVLQESVDDDSITENSALERLDKYPQREDLKGGSHEAEEDTVQMDTKYFDRFPHAYNSRKRERRAPFLKSVHNNMHEEDGILPFLPEATLHYHPSSKGRIYPSATFGKTPEERRPPETSCEICPHVTIEHVNDVSPSKSARGKRFHGSQKEKSEESIDGKQSLELSFPITVEVSREMSVEHKDDTHDEFVSEDSSTGVEGEAMDLDIIIPSDTLEDGNLFRSVKQQKLSFRVEQPAVQDNGDDLRASHSSCNSKSISGSSRDYQKRCDSVEEEVVHDRQCRRLGDMKRHHDVDGHSFRRRDYYGRDGRQEMDQECMIVKGRVDFHYCYPHKTSDPRSAHYSRVKTEGFVRPKERDNFIRAWQRRDEVTHGRKVNDEDTRKPERGEEMGPGQSSKVRESERNEKDKDLHSRKWLDNGDWTGHRDKDVGSRYRERDDNLIIRHENLDYLHTKRRKDEEHQRREHAEKGEILHGYRSREDFSHRKRERGDVLDQWRKDDYQIRVRDKHVDHQSVRHRDKSWRQREKDEQQRLKQLHEDNQSKWEGEGREALRSGQGVEDKPWVGNVRTKDESEGSNKEYQFKDKKESEQPKRRDRVEDKTLLQHRGREDVYASENQFSNEDRSSRQERSSIYDDPAVNIADSQWMHKETHKGNNRKNKESERVAKNTLGPATRKQEDDSCLQNEKVSMKGTSERESQNILAVAPADTRDPAQISSSSSASFNKNHHEHEIPQQHHSSRKHREDVPSYDEHQDSTRVIIVFVKG
ncbi:hypothetical protein HHK36_013840 [Tetracentron sinense]|uniref:Pre-mRNA polyadenylation factor Fip1 domain-containing protein n=1 Tax=Tetracentron sinense TaxID=13715 RepID=A0A834Z7S7_TETSI|nr:hypothetical protein HHK36_013840 [Tetracentron sinense]